MKRALAFLFLAALAPACGSCRAVSHVFSDRLEAFYAQESQRVVRF